MRFLLDEGLPFRLAVHLSALGHDITAVGHSYPHALTDRDILEIATAEQRIILTNDKDFGDLIFRDRLPHAGVILFRLGYVTLDVRVEHLKRVLSEHTNQLDQVIVVTHNNIRVRSNLSKRPRRRSESESGTP
jgi:predicted nuclease of predicted toxin-antitoxin system